MPLSQRQIDTVNKIKDFSKVFSLDPTWPLAVAMVESSLGNNQISRTGCKGVFQMSSIAMKDLLQEMAKLDDDLIDISCGIAFLYLLLKRHKTITEATSHFCDPNDRDFYVKKVLGYMEMFKTTKEDI